MLYYQQQMLQFQLAIFIKNIKQNQPKKLSPEVEYTLT